MVVWWLETGLGAAEKPRVTGETSTDAAASSGAAGFLLVGGAGGDENGTGSALPSSMPIRVSMFDSTLFTIDHSDMV